MLDNQLDKEQLRERVEAEIQRSRRITRWTMFGLNIFMFILFMAISWGIALGTPSLAATFSDAKSPLPSLLILPMIGWALGIFFHLLSMLAASGAMDRSIRRRVMAGIIGEQVLESIVGRAAPEKEKIKRDQRLRLSDDGELVPADEEPDEVKKATSKQSQD